jgi:hypothetical protein
MKEKNGVSTIPKVSSDDLMAAMTPFHRPSVYHDIVEV